MRRSLIVLTVVAASVMAAASPAVAAKPTIWKQQYVYGPDPEFYGVSCGSFDIMFTADSHQLWMDFYNNDGTLARETVQFSFTGMLYNGADLSKKVAYEGGGYWWMYTEADQATSVYHYKATIDGQVVPFFIGSEVFTKHSGDWMFHGLEDYDAVCAALS